MKQWLFDRIVAEKFNNFFGLLILLIMSLAGVVAIAYLGLQGGIIILSVIIGLPVLMACLINTKFAYLLLMTWSTFMGFISRFFKLDVPFGVGIDVVLLLVLFGIILEQLFSTANNKAKEFSFRNPISIAIIIWTLYLIIQVANPAGTIPGWFYGLRETLRVFVIFIIAQRVFDSLRFVHFFTTYFIALGLIVALYGIYQEVAGLPGFDLQWATLTDERINLLFIQGKWRKWSFLSDPAIFGMFMSFCGIMSCILALGPFKWSKKIFFFLSGIIMLVAMFFSGTRSAYAMVPAALSLFVIINISKVKTLIFACLMALVFLILYFGPFYSKPINRFRSAFNPSDDPSMNLRDRNRERIQPYIYAHPFGGGLTTTGPYGERFSPGHRLAGFPPDSGYLKTLLETGWVGLIFELGLYFTILAVGISDYYNTRDPVIKAYQAAFIMGFFSLTIALYAKENIEQYPQNFILYAIYVLMYKLKEFDTDLISKT